MSSTISIARVLATALAIVTLWYGAMAALFRVTEQAPGAMVIFPDRYLSAHHLPDGVAILKWNRYFAVLAGDAGYVGELYDAGVPLVFPARNSGCISYRAER
ncbi:hypothetical protein OIU34_25125 [Pararhizobium sp. BT-229]|uniref:hypothetical protein n=1 Tax=Pararhizobium sp. BT-229 TaxID=2986923 RepID=UPI0021F7F234|nr:hypothetical protein [Pararhizobium sp. BT-229]MCV9965164.1 hypothetical protein [Pararhizobium sp. BT-229]